MNGHAKEYFDAIEALVRETSHLWFMGIVASSLTEAGPIFSELIFTESFDPELSIELRKYYTQLMMEKNDWRDVSFAEIDVHNCDLDYILRTNYVLYSKGGMILYMLYQLLREALFDVFHEYFERYGGTPGAHNEVALEDFISIANEKKDMSWFFDEWVYHPGLPNYERSNLSIGREKRIRNGI